MSIKESLQDSKQTLDALLSYANGVTGKSDVSIGDAIKSLADGFGGGGGGGFKYSGANAELLATQDYLWTLADTSFVIGSTEPTSNLTIRATTALQNFSLTASPDKDIIAVQKSVVIPTHVGADNAAVMKRYAGCYVTFAAWGGSTRTIYSSSQNILEYYDTKGALQQSTAQYGLYMNPQQPIGFNGSGNTISIAVKSPIINCRAAATYESGSNMKKITACDFKLSLEVYAVDHATSLVGMMRGDIEGLLNN